MYNTCITGATSIEAEVCDIDAKGRSLVRLYLNTKEGFQVCLNDELEDKGYGKKVNMTPEGIYLLCFACVLVTE